jgi:hypothetical protein
MITQEIYDTFMLLSSEANAPTWQEVGLAIVNGVQTVLLFYISATMKGIDAEGT